VESGPKKNSTSGDQKTEKILPSSPPKRLRGRCLFACLGELTNFKGLSWVLAWSLQGKKHRRPTLSETPKKAGRPLPTSHHLNRARGPRERGCRAWGHCPSEEQSAVRKNVEVGEKVPGSLGSPDPKKSWPIRRRTKPLHHLEDRGRCCPGNTLNTPYGGGKRLFLSRATRWFPLGSHGGGVLQPGSGFR